jgi:CRP-like cAMP-binding protein
MTAPERLIRPDRSAFAPNVETVLPGGLGQNVILAGLPARDRERVIAAAKPVVLATRDVLYHANEPVRQVYFLTRGVCSLITVMRDGSVLEVGMVGHEGVVGIPAVLGGGTLPSECWVHVPPCEALVVSDQALARILTESTPLRERLYRYTQALFAQIMQSVACNGYHTVLQRCCRWLLMTQDRVGDNRFKLTHEFLSMMLGVRRASVSEVSERLQAEGIIRNSPGQIEIIDRIGLHRRSCECYDVVRTQLEVLLS